jgi:hypothetical protein
MSDKDDRYSMSEEGESFRALQKVLRAADLERLRVLVGGVQYDVPIPVGHELERLRQYMLVLSNIEEKTFIGRDDLAQAVRRVATAALAADGDDEA